MSLTFATLLAAALFLAPGAYLLFTGESARRPLMGFLRSRPAAIVLMAVGGGFFLWNVWHLGPADFGAYRTQLFVFFLAVGVLSFFYVSDFLAVRAGSICALMLAKALLDAAYMEPQQSRLLLVTLVYLVIVAALWLGATPYKLRDFFEILFKGKGSARPRALGALLAVAGLALLGASFTY